MIKNLTIIIYLYIAITGSAFAYPDSRKIYLELQITEINQAIFSKEKKSIFAKIINLDPIISGSSDQRIKEYLKNNDIRLKGSFKTDIKKTKWEYVVNNDNIQSRFKSRIKTEEVLYHSKTAILLDGFINFLNKNSEFLTDKTMIEKFLEKNKIYDQELHYYTSFLVRSDWYNLKNSIHEIIEDS